MSVTQLDSQNQQSLIALQHSPDYILHLKRRMMQPFPAAIGSSSRMLDILFVVFDLR